MYTCLEAMFTVDDISMLEGLMTVMMFMVFLDIFNTSHVMRKPVFGVCDLVRLKPASAAIEAS